MRTADQRLTSLVSRSVILANAAIRDLIQSQTAFRAFLKLKKTHLQTFPSEANFKVAKRGQRPDLIVQPKMGMPIL